MPAKQIFSIVLLCLFYYGNIEAYSHKSYDWDAAPKLHSLTGEEEKSSSVIIKHKNILEYVYEESGELYLYQTQHKIIRVQNDQAVETFNKVFVLMEDVVKFEELKARAIAPDGTVTELNKDNIKEIENYANAGAFKLFAIEGAVKGGEVEYFYTTQSMVREPYGRAFFQGNAKIKEATIEIISPKNLVFEAKGYNGFPELGISEKDSLRIITGTIRDLSPYLEESYAYDRANLAKVAYKLAYNKSQPKERKLYSWETAAEWFGTSLYLFGEEAEKAIEKELKKLKIKKLKGVAKISKIEDFIKTNIAIKQGGGPEYIDVQRILVNRYASEVGLTRIFAAFLKVAKIEHELVITSDRTESKFDKDFEDWNNFTEVLFYFPTHEKYLTPSIPYYRVGLPPYEVANNYGLFIKSDAKSDVRFIEMPAAEASTNVIKADVNFNEDFDVNLAMRYSWTGYRGTEFRAAHQYNREFLDDRITAGMTDAKVENVDVSNGELIENTNGNKPFLIDCTLKVNSLIEKAGKSYLFKIGEIIGSQMELYQEHARQNPVDMPYPTYYRRSISFNIPKGYRLEGLDDLKIDKFMDKDGQKVNQFISEYKIEGQKVTVTANEYYRKINLPKENYENFRQVINAAADFNKVVLVFEKEETK